jgi:hypothetical protein
MKLLIGILTALSLVTTVILFIATFFVDDKFLTARHITCSLGLLGLFHIIGRELE